MTTLAAALGALVEVAGDAGLDPSRARREGECLAAIVIGVPSRLFVEWCEETGRPRSSEAMADAGSQGRRYLSSPTPTMSLLASISSPHAAAYAQALTAVGVAAAEIEGADPSAIGRATTAGLAQLGAPTSLRLPTLGDDAVSLLRQQLPGVLSRLGSIDLSGLDRLGGLETGAGAPSSTDVGSPSSANVAPAPVEVEPAKPESEPEPEKPKRTVEELLAELDSLVGLDAVKAEVHRQAAVLRVEGLRAQAGLKAPTITRHMVFNGNPGTGKTTVARLVAGIYQALGLLSQGQLVEVDRSELVAGFLGQTAIKTAEVVTSAEGGVLFIDEAYSLAGDQYGTEAIDTLVKEMEDRRDDLVVIVAGYPLPMAVFIAQNPGLESRFRTTIDFVDYTDDELVKIFGVMAAGAEYDVAEPILERLATILSRVVRGPTFGNARYVRNLLEAAIGRHAWRLREVEKPTLEQLRTLEVDDLELPQVDLADLADLADVVEVVEVGPPTAVGADPGTQPEPESEETP